MPYQPLGGGGLSPPTRGNRTEHRFVEGASRKAFIDAGGLSPPTRGNRRDKRPYDRSHRSIPAHAGEPVALTLRWLPETVYPRPRGGTDS